MYDLPPPLGQTLFRTDETKERNAIAHQLGVR